MNPSFPPRNRDWVDLKYRLPGKKSKEVCEMGRKLHRKLKTATRIADRGHMPDSELLMDINNTAESLVRQTLMLIVHNKGEVDDISPVLNNLKQVRKNIRSEWDELIKERNEEKLVKHLKEVSDFLFSVVYSSLINASADIGEQVDRALSMEIVGKLTLEVEPEKATEENQWAGGK